MTTLEISKTGNTWTWVKRSQGKIVEWGCGATWLIAYIEGGKALAIEALDENE